jgi:hypothetical protein
MEVIIEDGMASIVFPSRAARLRGVNDLLRAAGDPSLVVKVTLPEVAYIVPEAVARSAGFVDVKLPGTPTPAPAAATAPAGAPTGPVTAPPPIPGVGGYDDGKPDMDWSRGALDAYATGLGIDPKQYRNKESVLEAIRSVER